MKVHSLSISLQLRNEAMGRYVCSNGNFFTVTRLDILVVLCGQAIRAICFNFCCACLENILDWAFQCRQVNGCETSDCMLCY